MILNIMNILSYLADDFVLLIINPLGSLMVMLIILYAEKNIIKNIKINGKYNHAVHVKIKEIN